MDSLYVRLKFGISINEFLNLFEVAHREQLQASGAVTYLHSTETEDFRSRAVIADRHKFLEWAKGCGLYDDIALDSLEYLICQEMMNEAV